MDGDLYVFNLTDCIRKKAEYLEYHQHKYIVKEWHRQCRGYILDHGDAKAEMDHFWKKPVVRNQYSGMGLTADQKSAFSDVNCEKKRV